MIVYETVSQAVKGLKERGFSVDFNLAENCIVCHEDKFNSEEFEITEIYRFEGNSDPSDEAVVYAIESVTGIKGVLVNGYGISADPLTSAIAKKLSIHKG
ncbi:MAG TPA: hypothetical protein PK275_09595 [Chitinophagaceae bacterium]|jgi:hypothetical protein|nr:hypothetical protein [Chitinophagaceae bacterium]